MDLSPTLVGVLPSAPPYAEAVQNRLHTRLQELGSAYVARTELRHADGTPRFTNRLLFEDAPYLLQHAHNPVDWYPWGEEAFACAKAENKPIFLSIGYATCHWCHVMERESFDNIDIASQLNRDFIAIKVDRERHPAVDSVYMTALVVRSGHGGWPMSSFLTPNGEVFFNGTYYPPDNFKVLLQEICAAWQQQQSALENQAAQLSARVKHFMAARAPAQELSAQVAELAVSRILAMHDDVQGGFGDNQKFPQEPWLMLLAEETLRYHDARVRTALERTLDAIMNGGIHDQIGGGFHRYTVEPTWLVPHFEKMLYNQAQLARVYLRAWRVNGNLLYARTARQSLDYVLRDQLDGEGCFYSATDADSETGGELEEGAFFLWTPEQLQAALNPEQAELAADLFGVTDYGNFEGHGSILHLPEALPAYAYRYGLPLSYLLEQVDILRAALYKARQQRPAPLCDDKVITAWNGLFISALAEAAETWQDDNYRHAAQKAATSLWRTQWDGQQLWRIRMGLNPSVPGTLQDYAMFAEALLCLDDIDPAGPWRGYAETLVKAMNAFFWDDQQGGYYLNRADDTLLMLRPKEAVDDAIPAANGVALRVLVMLAARTDNQDYEAKANALIQAFAGAVNKRPEAFASLLMAGAELHHGGLGLTRYAAHGQIRLQVQRDGEFVHVDLHLAAGIHINAARPLDESLTPTRLSGEGLTDIVYPPATRHVLGTSEMAVYEGDIRISARFPGHTLKLSLQACDNKMCLPPQYFSFLINASDSLVIDSCPSKNSADLKL
jgi:uncharacterized protein